MSNLCGPSRRRCRPGSGAASAPTTTCSRSNASWTSWRGRPARIRSTSAARCSDKQPRFLAALNLAAEKSGWGQPLPPRVGRGVCVQPSFASFIATVVEAEVDEQGEVHLRRVTSAVDTGIAVNPDTIMAQLEGGLIFGLTAALYGEITIDKGRVQQSNFNDYRMLRIDQAPKIEVHVIKSGEAPGGIGETGATAGPPALRNAIYAATGVALAAASHRPVPDRGGKQIMSAAAAAFCFGVGRDRRGCGGGGNLDRPRPRPDGVRGRPESRAGGLQGRRSHRRPGFARQGKPGRARRISRAGGGLHGLPHHAGRQGICRRPRIQTAVRHAVFDQHHAGQRDRHRQLQRSGLPQRGPSRHPPRRRAALSGDAVHVLYLHHRRGCAGDQGLSVQPAAGTRGCSRQHADVSVQPALGDDVLVSAVQSGYPVRARHVEKPGMEQGRLSRRSAGALRRMPYAAKSGVRARQPQEIRRRADGGLARLQHQFGQGHRRRLRGATTI